ncbi:glycosyltransferase family 2 protein [Desulfopila sp. IMCC35008]|uniref:glycosyltransferase n=1 Tax=Desulfopila sp. IMCC35008 TaxID=2653858 RepID=UPI0013D15B35|nr:glycosyltransferase family A protein [Desulfopila sp. IMCC35008]
MNPNISVIVPVYNSPYLLGKCLDALSKQTCCTPFEAIVVDNCSDDFMELQQLCAQFDIVKLVREFNIGSYAARNKGLSIAKGSVIVFTDADCIPTPGWLKEGWLFLEENPDTDLLAGKVDIFPKAPNKPTIVEIFESFFSFQQENNCKNGIATTANLFIRRGVFEDLGNFDTSSPSGGDIEFTQRATVRGYSLNYAHNAVVKHPARHNLKDLRLKIERVNYGVFLLRKKCPFMKKQFELKTIIFKGAMPPLLDIKKAWRDSKDANISIGELLGVFAILFFNKYYTFILRMGYILGIGKNNIR